MNEKQVFSIVASLAAVGAGFLANKGLQSGWMRVTGHEAPQNPESDEVTVKEAVAWALVSGALIGLARMLGQRYATKGFAKAVGHKPEPVR